MSDPPPPLPEGWNRCRAFMVKKKRHCRQMPIKGTMFCGNHVDFVLVCHPFANKAGQSTSEKTISTTDNQSRIKRLRIGLPQPTSLHGDICEIISSEDTSKSSNRGRGKRIPCPIDPSHTIYESNLKAHLKKCNKITQKKNEESKIYYQNGVNLGGFGIEGCKITKGNAVKEKDPRYYKNLAIRILKAYEHVFASDEQNDHMVDEKIDGNDQICDANTTTRTTTEPLHEQNEIINLTHQFFYEKIPKKNLFKQEQSLGLEDSLIQHRVKIGGAKHLEQVGSIVGHVRAMIHTSNSSLGNKKVNKILEMGAGRATTGFVVASVVAGINNTVSSSQKREKLERDEKVKLILVERAGSRGKADRAIQREKRINGSSLADDKHGNNNDNEKSNNSNSEQNIYMDVNNVDIQRIKCDLANVHLPTVLSMSPDGNIDASLIDNEITSRDILVIAKHCCGAGTDLALKSLIPIKKRIHGCIFTTCCHGVCSWENYVGRVYLKEVMEKSSDEITDMQEKFDFGAEEFDLMRRWACGTVIGQDGIEKVKDTSSSQQVIDEHNDTEKTLGGTQPEHMTNLEFSKDDSAKNITHVVKSFKLCCGLEGLGRACQRLIDFGRCEFMKHQLFDDKQRKKISLSHYVDSIVTPQNALLSGQCT